MIHTRPNILIDQIIIEKDSNDEYGTKQMLNSWGRTFPIIKINEYILSSGELLSFEMTTRLNSLPTFEMSIEDSNYQVRESLKKQIDKCVIFIGYKTWYIKYNGLITNTYSDAGDANIILTGILFNDKLFETFQKSYVGISVIDILKDLTTKSSMGLFAVENETLNFIPEYCLNTNLTNYQFLNDVVKKYTDNLWCIDFNYFYHIGNINNLREQKIDKYTLNQKGESIKETDIILTSNPYNDSDDKLTIEYYSIDTNFGKIFSETYNKYMVNSNIINSNTLNQNENKIKSENTFNRFEGQYFPFYEDRINKMLCGDIIKITTKNLIFEITPFSIVGLELYLPKRGNLPIRLDEEHSGNKIVIGCKYSFSKANSEITYPTITQSLELI